MKKFQQYVPYLIILSVLLASMACGVAYAKYVTDKNWNGQITIQANLGTIEIWEGEPSYQAPNGYTLGERKVSKNAYSYILIPGYDIPKDSSVHITEKSAIGAYIFLEVNTNIKNSSNGVSYAINSDYWTLIPDLTGVHGGPVYYYKMGVVTGPLAGGFLDIPILVDNQITVSQKLKSANIGASVYMNFYASMGQADAGNSAEEVYTTLFQTS